MNINLFKLALERLEPSDWEEFERLASAFLCRCNLPFEKNLFTLLRPTRLGGFQPRPERF
jgi:hypothetical protein